MKRSEKLTLLKRVFQGQNPDASRKEITQVMENSGRGLVIIYDLPTPGEQLADTDMVSFHDHGTDHRMTLGEANQYASRHFVSTIFLLPAKEELALI